MENNIKFKNRNPFEETLSYDEWKIYRDYIKPTDIVYDIGAHTGWMSEYFCQISKHVYAFEPVNDFFKKLQENTAEFNNITYLNTAIGNDNYSIEIPDCHWHSRQTFYYKNLEYLIQSEKLETPSFIKLDIEGDESIILKSWGKIFSFNPIIFVELHNISTNNFKSNNNGGFDWNSLKEFNYSVKKFNYGGIRKEWSTPIDLELSMDWNPKNEECNYLLIPKKQ